MASIATLAALGTRETVKGIPEQLRMHWRDVSDEQFEVIRPTEYFLYGMRSQIRLGAEANA
jgi:hypothetical protein